MPDITSSQKYFSSLNRAQLAARTRRVLHQGSGVQCTILLVEANGYFAAVKDYSQTPTFFRLFVAPFLLRREVRALRALQNVPQVPLIYGTIDRLAFVMEFVDGTPISELSSQEIDLPLLQEVQHGIDAIHQQGVSHGDMKRRTNFLVTTQRQIKIIDFASAIIAGPLSKGLQKAMVEIDNKAVPKIKKLGAPHLMTDQDWHILNTPTTLERWARKLLGR